MSRYVKILYISHTLNTSFMNNCIHSVRFQLSFSPKRAETVDKNIFSVFITKTEADWWLPFEQLSRYQFSSGVRV